MNYATNELSPLRLLYHSSYFWSKAAQANLNGRKRPINPQYSGLNLGLGIVNNLPSTTRELGVDFRL